MWFHYKGFNKSGAAQTGFIEGTDKEDVITHLRTRGVFGVSLEEHKEAEDTDIELIDSQRADKSGIKTADRKDIIDIRFDYENLRKLLRSLLLDLGVTEDTLRGLIMDLKSDDPEKQKKVVEFVEDMGFEKEALELAKAFLFRTDFNNTVNPKD